MIEIKLKSIGIVVGLSLTVQYCTVHTVQIIM